MDYNHYLFENKLRYHVSYGLCWLTLYIRVYYSCGLLNTGRAHSFHLVIKGSHQLLQLLIYLSTRTKFRRQTYSRVFDSVNVRLMILECGRYCLLCSINWDEHRTISWLLYGRGKLAPTTRLYWNFGLTSLRVSNAFLLLVFVKYLLKEPSLLIPLSDSRRCCNNCSFSLSGIIVLMSWLYGVNDCWTYIWALFFVTFSKYKPDRVAKERETGVSGLHMTICLSNIIYRLPVLVKVDSPCVTLQQVKLFCLQNSAFVWYYVIN